MIYQSEKTDYNFCIVITSVSQSKSILYGSSVMAFFCDIIRYKRKEVLGPLRGLFNYLSRLIVD